MNKLFIINLVLLIFLITFSAASEGNPISITVNEKFNGFNPNISELHGVLPLNRIFEIDNDRVVLHCWYLTDSFYLFPKNYLETIVSAEYLIIKNNYLHLGAEFGGGLAFDKEKMLFPITVSASFKLFPESMFSIAVPLRSYQYSNGMILDLNGYLEFRPEDMNLIVQAGGNIYGAVTVSTNINGERINPSLDTFGYGLFIGLGVEL